MPQPRGPALRGINDNYHDLTKRDEALNEQHS